MEEELYEIIFVVVSADKVDQFESQINKFKDHYKDCIDYRVIGYSTTGFTQTSFNQVIFSALVEYKRKVVEKTPVPEPSKPETNKEFNWDDEEKEANA